jgi:tetratricopeptide (TPR) repeat protein
MAYERKGDLDRAAREYSKVVVIDPSADDYHVRLGQLLIRQGKLEEAAEQFEKAIDNDPELAAAHHGLGLAHALQGKDRQAEEHYRRALDLRTGISQYERALAHTLEALGQHDEARERYDAALRQDPNWPDLVNADAWRMATAPDPRERNGTVAVHLAGQACEATGNKRADLLDTLAAAYAEAGLFDLAQATATQALAVVPRDRPEWSKAIANRLHLYQTRQPYRTRAVGSAVAAPAREG